MHAGKNYSFAEVLFWTRRDILFLLIVSAVPVFCYSYLGCKWLSIPWLPIALLGTAVAFAVGFRNNASYDRTWEARKAWGAIVNASRAWSMTINDYVTDHHAAEKRSPEYLLEIKMRMMQRHFAWLTALRYQLREPRTWESIYKKHNQEFKDRWFKVQEHNSKMEDELRNYLSPEELADVMAHTNKANYIISLQSKELRRLREQHLIDDFRHMELEKLLIEFLNQQGACERIKNFPYPRQYATLNMYFIKIFVILVPMGMMKEFNNLGEHMVWLSVPFSALSTWIFTTMEKIGESTESPFEGSANDVPITALCRTIEIDIREVYNDKNIPPALKPENNILV